MGETSAESDRIRDLFRVSQALVDYCHGNRSPGQMVNVLCDEFNDRLNLSVAGCWVHHSEWISLLDPGEFEPDEFPPEIERDTVTEGAEVDWWPVPDSAGDRLIALIAINTPAGLGDLRKFHDELLPALRTFARAVQSQRSVARHELLEPPEDVSPDVKEARRSGGLDAVLQTLVESAGRLFECDNCRLFWLEDEDTIRLRAESSNTGEVGSTLSVEQDPIIQSVLGEEKTIIINNLPDHDGHNRRDGNIRSFLSVPFRHGDRVLGTLNLSSEDQGVYTRDTLEQLSAVADNFALVHEITRELTNLTGYVEEILANLPVGVVSVEPDRDLVRLNPEAKAILGSPGDRLEFQVFRRHVSEQLEAPKLLEVIQQTREGRDRRRLEFQVEREGRHPRTLEAFSSSVENVEDRSDRLIVVLNDVTEQKKLSEQVNRTERLAALGELAAGLAHEIKNPLTSIQGFVQLLPERGDDPDFLRKTSEVIGRESRRLNALVDNLVSFAKPQVGSRSEFLLNDITEDVEMLIKKQLEQQGIDYTADVPGGLTVFGDDQKLKQVLINLTLNAIDAMEGEGQLSVQARENEEGFTSITVEDTGRGISQEALDQVFNPFYTTKEDGTGLGLAISHRIVEEHGGTIEFDSEPGEGTRVEVVIPPKDLQQELHSGDVPPEHIRQTNRGHQHE